MLTDEEKREIDAELLQYPTRRAVGLEALRIVQHHRGWVSDESLHEVADYLGLTAEELDGAATFYNLLYRKPVGRHVIHVCNSISCWVMGYDGIRNALTKRLGGIELGGTTADGRFTLLPIVCLGCCDHAPALMIDADLHMDLTPEKLDDILARYQ
jgi:NADH-quinone oxidoreductase subunit E